MQEQSKNQSETQGYTLAERLVRLVEWTKKKCRTLSQVKALSSKRLMDKDRTISAEEFKKVRAGLRNMLA